MKFMGVQLALAAFFDSVAVVKTNVRTAAVQVFTIPDWVANFKGKALPEER
ncbi:hypothetical protein Pan181_44560 [Aeoliella mucimassa]|uniref:Uncharacterized protein n=1 Tax=Aeoliella mucimassa TaxID=2527972 RepID=A0A518AU36_9BACT|nr:hypothetical protein Pan181_44560 [Aeoliella mucimassa]